MSEIPFLIKFRYAEDKQQAKLMMKSFGDKDSCFGNKKKLDEVEDEDSL